MATEAQVRGYLLEEVLAWLLRNNGYELLTAPVPGDPALATVGAGLAVRGRGACHQADVLGEFPFTPPFSLPVRMFVEAKSFQAMNPVGLGVIRNAWATVADVNEFDVGISPNRYRYVYTLFSTSGFTAEAAEFALTHQISLVDLTLPMYSVLRAATERAAAAVQPYVVGTGTVEQLRRVARHVLGTADLPMPRIPGGQWLFDAIQRLQLDLQAAYGGELLLAFPPAPFVLALIGDVDRFLSHADRRRDHRVNIYRDAEDETATGWILQPANRGDLAYTLRFSLPAYVEDWLMVDRRHARQLKQTSLSTITVYQIRHGVPRAYQLRYTPRPRTAPETQ